VVRVEPEVLQQLGVVHVVWVVGGHGEVAETHHLFGGVDYQGAIDAGSLWRLLKGERDATAMRRSLFLSVDSITLQVVRWPFVQHD